MLLRWLSYACFAAIGPCAAAGAMTITVDSRSVPGMHASASAHSTVIRLTGAVLPGDTEHLRAALTLLQQTQPAEPLATVELSSVGGDLVEGLQLGYLLHEFGAATLVRKGDVCLSTCALAFLGGAQRQVEHGGRLAFHNFSLNPARLAVDPREDAASSRALGFSEARGGAARLLRYVADMNVGAAFLAHVLGVPPEEFEYVDTAGEYLTLHACPVNLKRPPVGTAAQATNICNHAFATLAQSAPVSPDRATPISARHARRYLLEHLRQALIATGVRGTLGAELAAVLATRDEPLLESVYGELLAARVPLPDLIGRSYEVAGYRLEGEPASCFASLSLDDSDRFDVVLLDRRGFARAVLPATDCPRLLLYDSADVINPSP